MEKPLYIRLHHRIQARPEKLVRLEDIAQLVAEEEIINKVSGLEIYKLSAKDKSIKVLDVMKVMEKLHQLDSSLDIQTFGPAQTIVEIPYKSKQFRPMFFLAVWLLLFLGAALAIMNFHEDVSMRVVHQKIFKTITGLDDEKPLLLQIPYSIGLGLGMVLFFNHVFRKRINEEPSPLEVEMFNYQQDLDQYVIMHEQRRIQKKLMTINIIFVVFLGLAGGLAVGSGFVAFLAVLGIIPRLTQLTKTVKFLHSYEWGVIGGALFGSWISLNHVTFHFPSFLAIPIGLFCGVFIGLLAAALTEVLNVLPILAKRIGVDGQMAILLMAIVFGKIIGSLYHWLVFVNL